MEKIGIVVDSTADLPLSFYRENNVKMVPLTVRFGEEVYKDWIEMPPSQFYKLLKDTNVLPKTSQPTVAEFIQVYQKLSRDFSHIISLHLSSKLSGTVNSAELARKEIKVPVTIIDSKTVSGGIGLILKKMVEARDEGKTATEIINLTQKIIEKMKLIACLQTLKYLEMGGRIGKAQAFLGSLLDIKPFITFEDGIVAPYKRVRGAKRVLRELVRSLKEEVGEDRPIHLGLAHGDNQAQLNELKTLIEEEGFNCLSFMVTEIGSVIGTYAGPGALAIFFYPEE